MTQEIQEPDSPIQLELMPEDINYIILGLKDINEYHRKDSRIEDELTRQYMIQDNERIIEYLESQLTTYMHRKALYR